MGNLEVWREALSQISLSSFEEVIDVGDISGFTVNAIGRSWLWEIEAFFPLGECSEHCLEGCERLERIGVKSRVE